MIHALEPRLLFSGALPGDANSDGVIDVDDYGIIDAEWASAAPARADFNLDGRINIDDYATIDGHVGRTLADVTGPRDPSRLVSRGSGTWTISEPGIYRDFQITGGQIVITAHGVTLRNFVIENPSTGAAIKFSSNDITGGLIEDGEISGGNMTNAVSGSNYTARRLHVHHSQSDLFRVKVNVTIENCWGHDYGIADGSHGDFSQMYPTDGGNITVRNNTIDASGASAGVFEGTNGVVIEGNHFTGGGNYHIYAEGRPETVIVGNIFGPSKYGTLYIGRGDRADVIWENNRRASTGELIPRPQ